MTAVAERICVTGGAGFLGRHVVAHLERRGLLDPIVPRSSTSDLRDPVAVDRLYKQSNPSLVIHLAARVGGIGANRRHPGTFFRDNMIMGMNVLEASRKFGTPK